MTLAELLVLALATWRVSSLVSQEDGPWRAFARLRALLGVGYEDGSEEYARNELSAQVLCMWCLPGPVALLWSVGYVLAPRATVLAALPFALWAVAAWIHSRGVRFRKRGQL